MTPSCFLPQEGDLKSNKYILQSLQSKRRAGWGPSKGKSNKQTVRLQTTSPAPGLVDGGAFPRVGSVSIKVVSTWKVLTWDGFLSLP